MKPLRGVVLTQVLSKSTRCQGEPCVRRCKVRETPRWIDKQAVTGISGQTCCRFTAADQHYPKIAPGIHRQTVSGQPCCRKALQRNCTRGVKHRRYALLVPVPSVEIESRQSGYKNARSPRAARGRGLSPATRHEELSDGKCRSSSRTDNDAVKR